MAFQIADDLLDYEGSEERTGKPIGQDLRERKVTLPLVEALRRCSPVDRERVRAFFTQVEPSDAEIASIVDLVRSAGGLDYARDRARQYAGIAEAALAEVPHAGDARDSLQAAIGYAIERSR
jgi:octaprenyl-diphosphate synthase